MYYCVYQCIYKYMEPTTLRVDLENKKRLDELKIHSKESYNEVIERLIEAYIDNEPLSEEEIKGIEESLEDIKAGRVYSLKEVRSEIEEAHNRKVPGNSHGAGEKGRKKTAA